jgi:hypothetical protein
LVGKPEKTRLLRIPRHRWEHVKMYRTETRWDDVDLMLPAYDRGHLWALVKVIMNLLGFIKCWEILD